MNRTDRHPVTVLDRIRDESGAISMMGAVLALAMTLAGSLAVDVGRVAYVSRDQQGATDLAVLDATRAVRNQWTPDRSLQEMYNVALEAAEASLGVNEGSSRDNGTSRDRMITELAIGYLTDTGAFQTQFHSITGVSPNADLDRRPTEVLVRTASYVDFVLGVGDELGGRDVLKRSIGSGSGGLVTVPPTTPPTPTPTPFPTPTPTDTPTDTPTPVCTPPDPNCPGSTVIEKKAKQAVATIGVASRLAELDANQSIIAGTFLDRLMDPSGTNGLPTFTAVGWDGLATATVPVADLVGAGLVLGTPAQVLDSTINVRDLMNVSAAGLAASDPSLTAQAQGVLADMSFVTSPSLDLRFGDLFGVDTTDVDEFLQGDVNVLDLVVGALQVANRDNLISFDLGGQASLVPGLADYALDVAIVEPPQFDTGPAGQDDTGAYLTRATTSQVAITGTIDVLPDAATGLLGDTVGGLVDDLTGVVDDTLDPVGDLLDPILGNCGGLLQPPCPPDTPDDPDTPDVPSILPPVQLGFDLAAAQGFADLVDLQCATATGDLTELGLGSSAIDATVSLNGTDVTLLPLPLPPLPSVDAQGSVSGNVSLNGAPASGTIDANNNLGVTVAPVIEQLVAPVLSALGISIGTVEGTTHDIQCTEIVVLPPTVIVLP